MTDQKVRMVLAPSIDAASSSASGTERKNGRSSHPGLPETDNFQNWPPWRPLVVETARRILDYTGGALVMPMTVLVEPYWREITQGIASYDIPVHHFVLHADEDTLRARIQDDSVLGPSSFRFNHLPLYAEAFQSWLGKEAHVIDTTELTPAQAASEVAKTVEII